MGKTALVFPGQGAQSVGMGHDAFLADERAKACFEQADQLLGYALSELAFNGPDEQLKLTYNTQPALLVTSIAYYEAAQSAGITADYVAGHSLGEYTALVAAGVLSFADAVKIVRKRGEFMDEAVPAGQGAMAAALGAERANLTALCAEITSSGSPVELANVNCPGQIVVSGSKEGVAAVVERGKEAGAKRVIPLEVSGPFHSSLMKPAAARLSEVLDGATWSNAAIPVVANVNAAPQTDAATIRGLLVEQVYSPVLWEDSVRRMIDDGVDTFIEIGPGSVLAGLIKKTNRDVRCVSLNSLQAIEAWSKEGLHA